MAYQFYWLGAATTSQLVPGLCNFISLAAFRNNAYVLVSPQRIWPPTSATIWGFPFVAYPYVLVCLLGGFILLLFLGAPNSHL